MDGGLGKPERLNGAAWMVGLGSLALSVDKAGISRLGCSCSEKAAYDVNRMALAECSRIGAWPSFWHFHVPAAVVVDPEGGDLSALVVEGHGLLGEDGGAVGGGIAVVDQFAAVECGVTWQVLMVVWATDVCLGFGHGGSGGGLVFEPSDEDERQALWAVVAVH